MLAYYVEWHMRRALAPLLFKDHDRDAAEAERPSIVRPAPRSAAALAKDRANHTSNGTPVQRFRSLLKNLGTICRTTVRIGDHANATFDRITLPTEVQQLAFELLGVSADAAM